VSTDWKKKAKALRSRAQDLREKYPAEALMNCRKAMEAIQYSIFEEIYGKAPEGYIPFDKLMSKGKSSITEKVPNPQEIEFRTIQRWGNYGSHYQSDGEPSTKQVDMAMICLDELIEYYFPNEGEAGVYSSFIKYYLSDLASKNKFFEWQEKTPKKTKAVHTALRIARESGTSRHLIARAIDLSCDNMGWALLSKIGVQIKELDPGFISSTGHKKLIEIIRSEPELFTLKRIGKGEPPAWKVRNIKLKPVFLVGNAIELSSYDDGWAKAVRVGMTIRKLERDYNIKKVTGKTLEQFIDSESNLFEKRRKGGKWEYRNLGPVA